MAYDAFVSYSHAADGRLAPSLQRAMQRLAKPWYRQRALRVFRDDASLSANPHLWASIQAALADAEWFVLLASPDAAASPWVNRELDYWLTHKSVDRILATVTGGTWEWDSARGCAIGTAVPARVASAFADEPRHLDLRWAQTETDLDLANARFRDSVAQLVAPMHGLAKDDLESEDVRLHRRARRVARIGVAVLVLLVVIALVTSAFALTQRKEALTQRDSAAATARAASASNVATQSMSLAGSNVDRALLLATAAYRLHDSADTRGALVGVLDAARHLVGVDYLDGAPIIAAAPSPRADVVALARRDETVELWETNPLHRTARVDIRASIAGLALSSDLRLLAVQTTTGDVQVRSIPDWSVRFEFAPVATGGGPGGHAAPLAFAPDATLFAFTDGVAPIEAATGAVHAATSLLSVNLMKSMTFNRDGRYLVVSGFEDTEILDVQHGMAATRVDLTPPRAPGSGVLVSGDAYASALAPGPTADTIAFGTASGDVGVYSISAQRVLWSVARAHASLVRTLSFDDDGGVLASTGDDGRVLIWDASSGARYPQSLGGVGGAQVGAFFRTADDGHETVVTVSRTGVAAWDLDSLLLGTRHTTLAPDRGPCRAVNAGLTIGGNTIASVGLCVFLWDKAREGLDPTPIFQPSEATNGALTSIDASGSLLAVATSGSAPGPPSVQLYEPATRRLVRTIELDPADVAAPSGIIGALGVVEIALRPDGRELAVVVEDDYGDHAIQIVDAEDGHLVRSIPLLREPATVFVQVARYSPDGHRLVLGNNAGDVLVFNATTGKRIDARRAVSTREIDDIVFAPDGTSFAVVAGDGLLRVWRVADRSEVFSVDTHSGPLGHAAFSPDSQTIATISWAGTLTRWNAITGERLGPAIETQTENVSFLTDVASGTLPWIGYLDDRLVTSGVDDTVTFWDLDAGRLADRACELAKRNLTHAEWQTYFPRLPYTRTCPQWPEP
jgi:WD40 repeat protein